MRKLDLRKLNQANYQDVLREFDRVSRGQSLRLISPDSPDWIVKLVDELRPDNLGDFEVIEDQGDYMIELMKTDYPK